VFPSLDRITCSLDDTPGLTPLNHNNPRQVAKSSIRLLCEQTGFILVNNGPSPTIKKGTS
ncbi:MAG: hypothetical protein ACK5TC_00225, partial [bacterium]